MMEALLGWVILTGVAEALHAPGRLGGRNSSGKPDAKRAVALLPPPPAR